MSASTTARIVRTGSKFADKVRNASIAAAPADVEHGREIYVYSHLQTKQVVYSLKRAVKNNKALRQLPYNGKKTVPAALRKDLWSPLAMIEFPAGQSPAGLSAFRMLREYRTLHETQWPVEFALDDKGKPLSRKLRGRKICDQRANSIADIAATLGRVTAAGEKEGEAAKSVEATVRWTDIFDAEYAASWPVTVVHDRWETTRNNRRIIEELPEEELEELVEESVAESRVAA